MDPVNLHVPTPSGHIESDTVPTDVDQTVARTILVVGSTAQKVFGGLFDNHIAPEQIDANLIDLTSHLAEGDKFDTTMLLLQISAHARALAFATMGTNRVEAALFAQGWDNLLQIEAVLNMSEAEADHFFAAVEKLPEEGFDSEEFNSDRELLAQGKCPCPKHRAEAGQDTSAAKAQIATALKGKDPDFDAHRKPSESLTALAKEASIQELIDAMPMELRGPLTVAARKRGMTLEDVVRIGRDGILKGHTPAMTAAEIQGTKGTATMTPFDANTGMIEMTGDREPTDADVPEIARSVANGVPGLTDEQRERVYQNLSKRPITDFTSGNPITIEYGDK